MFHVNDARWFGGNLTGYDHAHNDVMESLSDQVNLLSISPSPDQTSGMLGTIDIMSVLPYMIWAAMPNPHSMEVHGVRMALYLCTSWKGSRVNGLRA